LQGKMQGVVQGIIIIIIIIIVIIIISILWCSWSGDCTWNYLARFGHYILDMKVEKNTRILLCSWLPTGTYHKKSSDLDFFFPLKSGEFGSFFPRKKILWLGPCKHHTNHNHLNPTLSITYNGSANLEGWHFYCF
jgi:hypothetical protein